MKPAAAGRDDDPNDAGVFSDASDREDAAAGGPAPLADEAWMELPERERELWERVRTRAVRREAAELAALKLPAANVSRLMRLNPALPMRSAQSVEVLNYATVLMLQAVVRAVMRTKGQGSSRVQFNDIAKACALMRELRFLHPVEHTLDNSAMTLRAEGPREPDTAEFGADDGEGGEGGGGTRRGAAQQDAAAAAATSARSLFAAFARQASRPPAAPAAEGGGSDAHGEAPAAPEPADGGPAAEGEQEHTAAGGKKRRLPASEPKGRGAKAPRKEEKAGADGGPGPGLTAFFRRTLSGS